jgi:capsular polysaccharide biosynthesis protein
MEQKSGAVPPVTTDRLGDLMQQPPQGYFVVVPPAAGAGGFDVAALVNVQLKSWKLLLGAALLAGLIGAGISLQLPKKYRAQILIAPVTQNEGVAGGLRGQLGGLAALTGIDLGSSGGRREESLATLGSAGFARDFIVAENLLPVLFWEQWDGQKRAWKNGELPPSLSKGANKLLGDVASINEDRKTGLVTLTVEWYSPEVAARWANGMVESVNERLRAEATRNSAKSIEYLEKELAKTSVVELRQSIYHLIEDQVNNAMLANVQRQYAFRVIDPATTPETRASPRRVQITLASAVFGLIAGMGIVFLRETWQARRRRVAAAG